MSNSAARRRILYLKSIIERESDWQHGLTMERILDMLAIHGVYVERKTIYADFDALQEIGMDIQRPAGSDKTYRLLSRDFEVEELEVVASALLAYDRTPTNKTLSVLCKLKYLCSRMEARRLSELIWRTRGKN